MVIARSMMIGVGALLGVALAPFVTYYALQFAEKMWRSDDHDEDTEDEDDDLGPHGPGDNAAQPPAHEQQGAIDLLDRYVNGEWPYHDAFADLRSALRMLLDDNNGLMSLQLLERGLPVDDEAFFKRWLDPHMQLSCGYFGQIDADDLAAAQRQKMEAIARALQLKPGMHVLEIECGWGGLACYLAKEWGVKVTGVSRNAAQVEAAQIRAARANLTDPPQFIHGESSGRTGKFDRIVSISLSEVMHAPSEDELDRLLAPNGMAFEHSSQQPQLQVLRERDAPSRFDIESHDIAMDFLWTANCWLTTLQQEYGRGNVPAASKREWEFLLTCISIAVADGTVGQWHFIYTKVNPVVQVFDHADGTERQ